MAGIGFFVGIFLPLMALGCSLGVTSAYGHQMKPKILIGHTVVRYLTVFVLGLNIGSMVMAVALSAI